MKSNGSTSVFAGAPRQNNKQIILEREKENLDYSRNNSGLTSLENSNIPLVKSNKIVDDLENLDLDDFSPRQKTRPMTANASNHKKRTFSGVPPPSQKGNPGIRQDSKYQKSLGQTEMLEDLVGMVKGLDGDDDVELGSDYPYQNSENFRRSKKQVRPGGVPSTNSTSVELKNLADLEMQKKVDDGEVSHNLIQQPLITKKQNSGDIDITTDDIVEVLEQSLFEPYSIDPRKFDVEHIIKQTRKVDSILIQQLESKIQNKVNIQKRQLSKIFIDFGPYPLSKNWQLKKKLRKEEPSEQPNEGRKRRQRRASRTHNQKLFLPPDEDNFEHHGVKNLVIQYSEFGSLLELDQEIHKDSPFYRKHMLDGVLPEFVDKLNQYLEPIKDQSQNIDRFSLLFLFIGFLGTTFLATIVTLFFNLGIAIILAVLFILILGGTFYRNYRQLQTLQKSLLLNMAILVYLENQNVFLARGIRAQMGYMGNWIELVKERQVTTQTMQNTRVGEIAHDATFKRNLQGLQNGGIYMSRATMKNAGLTSTLGPARSRNAFDQRSTFSGTGYGGFRSMQRPISESSSFYGSPKKIPHRQNRKTADINPLDDDIEERDEDL